MKYIKGQHYYIKYSDGQEFITLCEENSDVQIWGSRINLYHGEYGKDKTSYLFTEVREAKRDEISYFEDYYLKGENSFTKYLQESKEFLYEIY